MSSYAALALLLPLLATPVAATLSLTVSTSAPSTVDGVSDLKVTTTLHNAGDEVLRLVNSPHSGLSPDLPTNIFAITKGETGASPDFRGIALKWSADIAAANDHLTVLNPGQSVDVVHDLSSRYDFTSAGPGMYDFKAPDVFTHVDATGNLVSVKAAQSSPTSLSLSGRLAVVPTQPNIGRFAKRAQFKTCTPAHETATNQAIQHAQDIANRSYLYVKTHTSATPRYTQWFGKFEKSIHSTVLSVFQRVNQGPNQNVYPFQGFEYDCGCAKAANRTDIYAYVFPDTYGVIHLCAAFWKAPLDGSDSKAGTLVHESSHFTQNGGTKDHAYGQGNAHKLGQSNPATAANNADNYEYFAENTPAFQ